MKQVILGTAGHIDHGKTSLIKAMTGIDTDRLKEEKERGITIELGFAHIALPSGLLLGIVDVPGHEKFVKNMVAGATGIDVVALIIAADEGIMPQTREHLEICELLRVQNGIVVLTKIDMVDPEWLEMVREDVEESLDGTFLEGAPVVEVSAVTGEGIDNLVNALDQLVQTIPERDLGNFFRLPIDRVFVMKGFGTVVTGTTVSGQIHNGDETTIYPQDITAKIRGIQVHNSEVTDVRAGSRTAINLQGVEKAQIGRGNILAAKGSLRPTYMVDVLLELLASAPRPLKNRAKARFHVGTAEIIGTVVLLNRDELKPGEACFAQLRLDEPIAVLTHDRFVLRSYSPVRAIGGGEILNPLPLKKKRFSEQTLQELEVFHKGDLTAVTELVIKMAWFYGREQKDLPFLVNAKEKRLAEVLQGLMAQKVVVQYDKERKIYIHGDYIQKAEDEIQAILKQYHKDNPLKLGLSKEEIRTKMAGAGNQRLFNYLVNQLILADLIAQEKDVLRLSGHTVTLAQDQEKIKGDIDKIYRKSALEPPYFRDLEKKFSGNTARDVLELMSKEGTLIKAKEDLYFHREAVEALQEKLVSFLKQNAEITTPQFKDMTGVSRKYAIPLIEYFDRSQVTVRVGDSRVLRKK